MRRIGLFLTISTVLLSSCSKNPEFSGNSDSTDVKGAVEVSLTAVNDHEIVVPMKSTVDNVPPVDSFKIEIFDESGTRIYRDKYVNTVENGPIYLNGGKHKLLASHGYALGVGFDAIYFAVEEPFTIKGQDVVPVSAVAKMANVKVSVNFGQNLQDGYSDYYAKVRTDKVKKYLDFKKSETRAGYIPAGELTFELYAKINGEWKYYPVTGIVSNPNEYFTFNVDTDPGEKDVTLSVTIDNTVDVIEKSFVIPADALPQQDPVVSISGAFNAAGEFKFISGRDYKGTQIDVFAEGGISKCVAEITSGYLTSLGLPAQVDLLTPGAAGQDVLEKAGFRWVAEEGGKFAFVSLDHIDEHISFDMGQPFNASVKLTVTDRNDRVTVSETYTLLHIPEISFAPQPYNAFAKRVSGLKADAISGNPSSVGLQWSQDQRIWNDAAVKEVSGKTVQFKDIDGLAPGTAYFFRTIYNNDDRYSSEPVSLTTEDDAQVGNGNFEDWKTEVFSYETAFSSGTCDWYLPFSSAGSAWWAVNSKKTMRSYCESGFMGIGTNFNYKNFPTVSWFNDGSDKSVQLATIVTGKAATNTGPGTVEVTKEAGEIWIGTAKEGDWSGGGGDHQTDGHAFESRPSAVSFNYQYFPYNNETFYVYVELKDKDGVSLFSKEITDGPAENTGKQMRIPIEYNDITKKAATIYMSFKSSNAQNPDYHRADIVMPNGKQAALVGSVLRIDDIKMIYE